MTKRDLEHRLRARGLSRRAAMIGVSRAWRWRFLGSWLLERVALWLA